MLLFRLSRHIGPLVHGEEKNDINNRRDKGNADGKPEKRNRVLEFKK